MTSATRASRTSLWSIGASFVAVLALTVTSIPAQAMTPSPDPSPSSGNRSPSGEPEVLPEDSADWSWDQGGSSGANTEADSEDRIQAEGLEIPESAPPVDVDPVPVDRADPAPSEAVYEDASLGEVVVPEDEYQLVTVVDPDALDALAADRATEPTTHARSIVVGAASAPLLDLAEAVLGDTGHTAVTVGRPDLVSEELPRVAAGSQIGVGIESQIGKPAIPGAAFTASLSVPSPVGAEWVDVAFDASGFANAYGASYGDRLQLVVLPECALTTPEKPECLTGVLLETFHGADGVLRAYAPAAAMPLADVAGQFSAPRIVSLGSGDLTSGLANAQGVAMAAADGQTIIAAVSGADSQAGTFAATDLAPRGTWGVTEPTGGFTYGIPVPVPPVPYGPVPEVSLNYSSQSTDGKTSASNSQASVVGEGWNMPSSYIERLFLPCTADGGTTEQICWASPYSNAPSEAAYVLSLGGMTEELVWTGTSGTTATYVAVSDPTLQVKRYFGASGRAGNGDNNGEYFEVRTSDGSVYYFGFNPGLVETKSIAWQRVWSNHAGEPAWNGSQQAIANEAYRFMLDLTVDVHGNAATYFYRPDTNHYMTTVGFEYVRDLQLERVEYGQLFDATTGSVSAAEAKVEFDLVARCVEYGQFFDSLSSGVDVSAACPELTLANAASYPDVPIDLICSGTACNPLQNKPTYFSTVRLNAINTFARGEANAWVPVETTQFIHAFPSTRDRSARSLWLDSVYVRGWGDPSTAADDVTTYLTKFSGTRLNNRVDWDLTVATGKTPQRALDRMRISSVWTDMGGRIDVTYAVADESLQATGVPAATLCPQGGMDGPEYAAWATANPEATINSASNTQLCFAVKSGDELDLFHNYVVTKVELVDGVAGTPTQTHQYTYGGTPAYAKTDSLLIAAGSTHDTTSFSSYRGFLTVATTMGDGSEVPTTTNQYYRGVSGDLISLHDGVNRGDRSSPRLQGKLESSRTTTPSGETISTSKHHYTKPNVGSTPSWKHAVSSIHNPYIVFATKTTEKTYDGTWSATSVTEATYHESLYVPIEIVSTVTDDVSLESETTCSSTAYATGTSPYLVLPTESKSYYGTCATGTMTSRSQVGYDGGTPGAATINGRGLVTEERVYQTPTDFTTSTAAYDVYGRILEARNPAHVGDPTPTVSWTYGTDGALWTTTTHGRLGNNATEWRERAYGQTIRHKGPNANDWTHYEYDALGLMVAGWSPQEWGSESTPDLTTDTPSILYVYDVYADGLAIRSTPVVVASAPFVKDTGVLYSGETHASTALRTYDFYDGWGRPLEQHRVAPDGSGGRVVTASLADAYGRVFAKAAPFFDSSPARMMNTDGTTALANLTDYSTLPAYTHTDFDGRGRVVSETVMSFGAPVHATTMEYAGRTTRVMIPTGAITENVTDVLGRVTDQYTHPESGYNLTEALHTSYDYAVLATASLELDGSLLNDGVHPVPAGVLVPGGEVMTVADTEGNETVLVSNWAGQRTLLADPNAGLSYYGYGQGGQVTRIDSEAGSTVLEYDDLGRMISRSSMESDGSTPSSSATWLFDPVGHVGSLLSESATTMVEGEPFTTTMTVDAYDDLHRPISTTVQLPDDPILGDLANFEYSSSVQYDALGRVVAKTLPLAGDLPAERVHTLFNRHGQPQSLSVTDLVSTDVTDLITGVEVNAIGQVQSRAYANGVERRLTWNQVQGTLDLAEVVFFDPDANGGLGGEVHLQADEYTRDGSSRVTRIDDLVTRAQGTPDEFRVSQCFDFDAFNRLSSAWTIDPVAAGDCATGAPGATDEFWNVDSTGYAAQWSYSDSGRMLTQDIWSQAPSEGGVPGAVEVQEQVFAYGGTTSHTVTSVADATGSDNYVYDDAGRLVSREVDGVTTEFTWDGSSNLVQTVSAPGTASEATTTYLYDASGQRVARIGTLTATAYFGDTEIKDADVHVSGELQGTRYYQLGSSAVAYRDGAEWWLMFGDIQGSATLVMENADPADPGTAVIRNAYTPYGASRGGDQFVEQDRGWLGQTEDHDTDLIYLNARYYDPALGRFLSPDPLRDLQRPETFDSYAYAFNNPTVFVDASGLFGWGDFTGWVSDHKEAIVVGLVVAVAVVVVVATCGAAAPALAGAAGAIMTSGAIMSGAAVAGGTAITVGGSTAAIATVSAVTLGVTAAVAVDTYQNTSGDGITRVSTAAHHSVLWGSAGGGVASLGVLGTSAVRAYSLARTGGGAPNGASQAENVAGPVVPYNRTTHYGGAQTSSPSAQILRISAQGTPCPSCKRPQVSGTSTAPVPEHSPSLLVHYYTGGHAMTLAQRIAYARSPQAFQGTLCLTCQRAQGGVLAHLSRQYKKMLAV
ncbi:MAG: hypothetical protein CVT64_09655 [Actinobacteria bacterium HGW-Actinobacteria-4]|nr:MAG: hypothetical protein CVT64_09655 [Actinobacteria bacterium HGW-Actinobacteria-4]